MSLHRSDILIELGDTTAPLGFRCLSDADGVTPLTGLSFAAGELKIGKRYTESNHAGTVTELAEGFYYYVPSAGEADTLGAWSLRLNKAGVVSQLYETQVVSDVDAGGAATAGSRSTVTISIGVGM